MVSTGGVTVRLTGGEALVRLLLAAGVREAFGIVGGKLAPLLHALSRSPIAFIGVRHEANAAIMAAADRKVHERERAKLMGCTGPACPSE